LLSGGRGGGRSWAICLLANVTQV